MRRFTVRGGVRRRDALSILTWRALAITALAVPAAVLVTLPTIGAVFARRSPAVATSIWPWGAEGNAALASGLVSGEVSSGGTQSERIERARMLAARALDRKPVDAMAAGVMAIADTAQGHEAASTRALAYGEWLSRRDLPTQLVLIERAVARGNVNEALLHYDRALRTMARAPDLLFPTLIAAADQPAITPSLARLLATRPPWWLSFTLQLVQQARAPAALVAILDAEHLHMTMPAERQIAITGMKRLVALGRVDLADRLDHGWQRRQGFLADTNFSRVIPFPPFDWELAGEGGTVASEEVPGGGRALLLTMGDGGEGGVVARQLTRLPAGRYRLAMHTEGLSAEGARPILSVACITGSPLEGALSVAARGDAREDGLLFEVPAGCIGQWVAIGVTPGSDATAPPPLVRTVRLTVDVPAPVRRNR